MAVFCRRRADRRMESSSQCRRAREKRWTHFGLVRGIRCKSPATQIPTTGAHDEMNPIHVQHVGELNSPLSLSRGRRAFVQVKWRSRPRGQFVVCRLATENFLDAKSSRADGPIRCVGQMRLRNSGANLASIVFGRGGGKMQARETKFDPRAQQARGRFVIVHTREQ